MEVLDLDEVIGDLTPESEFDGIVNGDTLESKKPKVKEDNGTRQYRQLTVYDILPRTGLHLGLDISKRSTGITLVKDGEFRSWNRTLSGSEDVKFAEILMRRELKDIFLKEFRGMSFETIVVEDAFEGENPTTTRMLYSLNTVIDEMVLDGDVHCKDFVRANNQSWKSWLWSIEPQLGKGLNEKVRIEELLAYLGVTDEGKGYQDRLDSLGMLVGYFFKARTGSFDSFKIPKITWSKVRYLVTEDVETLVEVPDEYRVLPTVEVNIGRKELTREYIKYLVSLHRGKLVIVQSDKPLDLALKMLGIPWGVRGTLVLWGI